MAVDVTLLRITALPEFNDNMNVWRSSIATSTTADPVRRAAPARAANPAPSPAAARQPAAAEAFAAPGGSRLRTQPAAGEGGPQ